MTKLAIKTKQPAAPVHGNGGGEWFVPEYCSQEFIEATPGLHWIIRQYMWNRGVVDNRYIDAYLNGDVLHDTHPHLMKDMLKANERVWEAINNGERIVVFGDYDADGVTATATMTIGLRALGAKVEWYVPERSEGYGANPDSVKELVEKYPDCKVLITVDNGIQATAAATTGVEAGLDFIITDHHNVNYANFPSNAYAVINPQQDDCDYHDMHLCGAGVAYKFIHGMAVVAVGKSYSDNIKTLDDAQAFADQCVDLVGMGTIGDMMPFLSLENRHIVRKALKLLAENPRPGWRQLAQNPQRVYKVDLTSANSTDLAFNMIPHISAAGRMSHPQWAVELLLAENESDAGVYARQLLDFNDARKIEQAEWMDVITSRYGDMDTSFASMPAIIERLDGCPKGLIGLVAGSLCNTYKRPAMVLTNADQDDGWWTASARSVVGMHIANGLKECSALLEKHGGHSMAAGFTIHEKHIGEFVQRMTEIAYRDLSKDHSLPEIEADIELPLSYIDWNLYDTIQALQPFNSVDWKPVMFVTRDVIPVDAKRWSMSMKHLKLTVHDGKGNALKANGWGLGEWADKMPSRIDIAYTLEIDDYDYPAAIRLALEAIRPARRG